MVDRNIDWIVHLSALLSVTSEQQMEKAQAVNLTGFMNVIELGRQHRLRIFCPSTIGAFGPSTPRDGTPDLTIMRPTTIYGITKVYMELMGEYYHRRFGVDFRSVRYPGIISAETEPGGGTTGKPSTTSLRHEILNEWSLLDYAVDIFHSALKKKSYKCYLSENTRLPMMYIPDCLNGTVKFLEAPESQLKQRVYNVAAFSFTPAEIAAAIQKHIPEFTISYAPDFRQAIADSWPRSLDDSNARAQWGWKTEFDLDAMVADMFKRLKGRASQH